MAKVTYIFAGANLNGYAPEGGNLKLSIMVSIGIQDDPHGFVKQENITTVVDGTKTINETLLNSDAIVKEAAEAHIAANYPPIP